MPKFEPIINGIILAWLDNNIKITNIDIIKIDFQYIKNKLL